MKLIDAVNTLAALAQPARLKIFRQLVRSDAEGVCAGDLAKRLALPKPTLSFHLKELANAGLIESRREGRSIFYRLRPSRVRQLMKFLTEDCCQGRPELCLPSEAECAGETCQTVSQ